MRQGSGSRSRAEGHHGEPTEQAIRERAYAIWEQEGRPDGKDLDHWLGAEAETATAISRIYKKLKQTVTIIVKHIITFGKSQSTLAIIALIVSVVSVYLNFFWHPESLKVYFRFTDPRQVGTSTLDLSYIFTDSGKQSYLIDSISIYEFWQKAPRLVTSDTVVAPLRFGEEALSLCVRRHKML
jgi:hypothetical protein